MRRLLQRAFWLGSLFVVCASVLPASKIGSNPPAQSLTEACIAHLSAGEQPAWRVYWQRSQRARAKDKATFAAELKSIAKTRPVEPAHGLNARSLPLEQADSWYASAQARQLADNVVSFQTPAGGWGKNLDFSQGARQRGEQYVPNNLSRLLGADDYDAPHEPDWNYVGTIDNDATTTELQWIARVIHAAASSDQSEKWRTSFARGIDYLLAAQAPNGGWPQVWPLEGGYHDAITFNDDAMTHVLTLLHEVAMDETVFSFVSESQRERAAAAFEKGIACTLQTQIREKGGRSGWAQQYDMLTLKPTSARNYEIPALSTGESAGVLSMLMGCLPHPNEDQRRAIRSAAAWLQRTAIYGVSYQRTSSGKALMNVEGAGPLWPRYLEIGSDKPIFGDRDKAIYDSLNDVSNERRNGYAWYGSEPQRVLDQFRQWSKQHMESK